MDILYTIKLDNGAEYDFRGSDSLGLNIGDSCVIRKDFYLDFGTIVKNKGELAEPVADLPVAARKASVYDIGTANENSMRTKAAVRSAQRFAEQLKLEMKMLNAHYSLDNKLITLQFTADGRVDFRELVKELARSLGARIELRQIGVRDESAIFGGIGVCGQRLCCCRFLKEFSSINVRMAKEQDLSLTPSSISGSCGRLKCCLKFEHEGYLELEKTMPRRGDFCECPLGRGKICDRNLLTQTVSVMLEDGGRVVAYPRSEIRVVYPEKYKIERKNDRPPRPAPRGDAMTKNAQKPKNLARRAGSAPSEDDTQSPPPAEIRRQNTPEPQPASPAGTAAPKPADPGMRQA